MYIPVQRRLFQRKHHRPRWGWLLLIFVVLVSITNATPTVAQAGPAVTIVAPDDGAILDGLVLLQANVSGATASGVEFFYQPNEAITPTSLGPATFDSGSGFWELTWDTRTVLDTFNDIDTNGDGIEDATVNLTKPPTSDALSVVAATDAGALTDAIDLRIQNMLTTRIFLPDNQEDLRGLEDLEVLVTGEFEITSVRFDIYPITAADPRIFVPFGEASIQGEPIENPHYGRPLGNPDFPTGSPAFPIGDATLEGARRWVFRDWDTTAIPDGTWVLVATATDEEGRRATYMVETYIVNDLRVVITSPADGASVSRFVALEARTSSMTGADNAAPGSLYPATSVVFDIGGTPIPATEIPSGSGRWRAIWDGDSFAAGPYTITATATNDNPNGAEIATDAINVTLVAPGPDLEAFFPFDWGNCTLTVCSFLDGSSGGPTSWFWEFGDGNTSTDQLPTHTYATYGVYTVRLTVSNDGGVTTDTYERVIPVGNTGVVGFNINPINDTATEFINWTSAFKNFDYTIGSTLAIPVMWRSTTGPTEFLSLPDIVCDADEDTPNRECLIFTPEEAFGTAPTLVGAAEDGVLFTMEFTEVQFRGITDVFKGKANLRIQVAVDSGDGNPDLDWTAQLGTNVDVTNSGAEGDETRLVTIISPFEGEFVGGIVGITASVVSSLIPDQVEFFLNGTTPLGVDTDGSNGWSTSWDTNSVTDGPYALTAVASFGTETTTSAVRNVNVENTIPEENPGPGDTFQTGRVNDTTSPYLTFPYELVEEGGRGGADRTPTINASMTAVIVPSSITVYPGGTPNSGLIGGDALEFDVILTNTSTDPGAVMTAYAFQSKFSESPALASRIGDKAFYGVLVPEAHPAGPMTSVKKNGTSNGLFPGIAGRWKGICINSSTDFIPEFNSGLEDESLECAGNRADNDEDGLPELQTPIVGIYPGQSQTVRVRIEAGTTDGALHVVQPGTLQGRVIGTPETGPNGITYFVPTIDPTFPGSNVLAIPDWGDNKVLRDADGTFNPTFAPLVDGLTFQNQIYLTLPRRHFGFTDLLGRNHTCETYGLDHINGIPCSGNPGASPLIGLMGSGDLLPGVPNLAAILHGFGEFAIDADGNPILDVNGNYTAPMFPYDTLCVNPATPDGLRCGARPYTPIAEFYRDNGDGTLTQQMVAGSYGTLGGSDQYTAFFNSATAEEWKEEVIPELDPGGPCDPIEDPNSRRSACAQLRTSATGHFHSLRVVPGEGINGGDAVEFTIDIQNTSRNPNAYLTAFNYQTKQRNLADIGGLDGFTQDRRDIRVDSSLPPCGSLNDGACYNATLGVGHFPNVIGNGLLFGQMVWQSGRVDRSGNTIVSDFVAVDPDGIDPVPFQLESVKKNGPFTPILKGNTNFICVKSGLFAPDQDADAACAGEPAILINPDGELVPSNIDRRLGLAPGQSQSVRIRMEYGDFRGAILQVVAGTLTDANVDTRYTSSQGLARFFDCEDQRELEFCHPNLVGETVDYLPNSNATWLEPETLEEIEWVIINQPGDAARIMNFQENFGVILRMAGFIPTAEFYAPDPNPELVGTPAEGVLIRQQVMGSYAIDTPMAAPLLASFQVTGCVDLTCFFDATLSSGAASYTWDFGDGTVVTEQPAIVDHTYAVPGNYTISLTAVDNDGTLSAPATNQVTVPETGSEPLLASFEFLGCADPIPEGIPCNFDASASSPSELITSYIWDFGDPTDPMTYTVPYTQVTYPYAATGAYTVTLTVADASGTPSAPVTNVITVSDQVAPLITSVAVTTGGVGQPYSYQVTATGNPAPTFGLDGPAGMTVDSTTGLIAWTPDTAGIYDVTVTATNTAGSDSQSFQVTVSEQPVAPLITSVAVTTGGVGQPYSYQVTATGNPAPILSLDLAPAGMTIDSVSGLITWAPDTAGIYDVTVTATNGVVPDATQSFQVTVGEQPVAPLITSVAVTTGVVGQPYSYQVTATGNPVPAFSLDLAPTGMTIDGAGLIAWTPDTAGIYDVTVRAANGIDPDATQSFQVTVGEQPVAPLITSVAVTAGVVGQPYNYQVIATGNPVPAFSLDLAPTGMTIDSVSGLITWPTPAVGTHDVTVRAANGVDPDATQSFQIVVTDSTPPPPPPSTYQLVFSTNENRSNPAGLDGAIVSGKIYVYVAPDTNVNKATFWLDGKKKTSDTSAPFDFVGGNNKKAKPFDTDKIKAGSHTIKVELVLKDKSKVEINATFTVGSAPPPNQPPLASFTYDCAGGLTCSFTNTSTDSDGSIASSAWDFGDSQTSSDANPVHLYGTAGDYTVTLTVTDDDGAPHSVSQTVSATSQEPPPPNQPPLASFTYDCAGGLTCSFTNTSTDSDGSIASSAWDFGDSQTSSDANPVHLYGTAGDYTVTLTVTDDDGAPHSVSQTVSVGQAPPPPPPATEYQLVFSTKKDRSNPAALEGATVKDKIYVFVTPDTNIKEVTFWLDGKKTQTEKQAPFDLMGGSSGSANPLDTKKLKKGEHQVKAEIILEDQSKVEVYATFTVKR